MLLLLIQIDTCQLEEHGHSKLENFTDNLRYNQKIKNLDSQRGTNLKLATTLKASVCRISQNNGCIQTQICVNKWF